jgi:hypothetical protein
MTVLIAVTGGDGEALGQCDARCYNAKHRRCKCVCSGRNHGQGLDRALDNTATMDLTAAAVTVTGVPSARVRVSRLANVVPLFPLSDIAPAWKETPMPHPAAADVWYHGHTDGTVTVESADGRLISPLPHLAQHSPTGFGWGYHGSGPADLARCILIHAAGRDAICPECAGMACPGGFTEAGDDCDQGYRVTPATYQTFKACYVAAWPVDGEWRMARSEVLSWLAPRLAVA